MSWFFSICPPTVLPYLAIGSGEGADIAHSDHGRSEIIAERLGFLAVGFDKRIGGSTVVQNLIGVQQPLVVDEVFVVSVVEECWRFVVEWGEVVVSRSTG